MATQLAQVRKWEASGEFESVPRLSD